MGALYGHKFAARLGDVEKLQEIAPRRLLDLFRYARDLRVFYASPSCRPSFYNTFSVLKKARPRDPPVFSQRTSAAACIAHRMAARLDLGNDLFLLLGLFLLEFRIFRVGNGPRRRLRVVEAVDEIAVVDASDMMHVPQLDRIETSRTLTTSLIYLARAPCPLADYL